MGGSFSESCKGSGHRLLWNFGFRTPLNTKKTARPVKMITMESHAF